MGGKQKIIGVDYVLSSLTLKIFFSFSLSDQKSKIENYLLFIAFCCLLLLTPELVFKTLTHIQTLAQARQALLHQR